MREIKFRAWDKKEKVMDEPFDLYNIGIVNGENGYDRNYYILMQYTGLHDKNGKEGYFDDLVRWGGSVYQVVWNKAEGITQLIKCSGFEVFATLPIKEMERGEIIGDIYSNPELLEVKCKE